MGSDDRGSAEVDRTGPDGAGHYGYAPEAGGAPVAPLMRLFNLLSDPKEETHVKDANPWLQSVTDRILNEFNATIPRYPHVPTNAPDPYLPPKS